MELLKPEFDDTMELLLASGSGHEVVWFLDYTCQTTRNLRGVLQRSIDRFEALDLNFALRFLPADEAGELAARAAIAAANQGRLDDMHSALFSAGPDYTQDKIVAIAKNLGLDLDGFQADLGATATDERLQRDRLSGQASATVPRTPMLFIDGTLYEGVWDDTALLEAFERPFGVRLELASEAFFHWAAAAGLVLVLATLGALAFVNFGGAETYEHLKHLPLGLSFGDWSFALPLEAWINDGLMALFFLVVGIEIKRELRDGELSDPARAAMPMIAAVGGMVVPAAIYFFINRGLPTEHGWGVPMATDIAFTLGILALLGDRVSTSLKVFVSALAIADDLGAILVIAIFYGHGFQMEAFLWAVGIFAIMLACNVGRIYSRTIYLLLGVLLWYFVHESGLHATLAGVLTAAVIPARPSARIEGAALQTHRVFAHELKDPDTPVGAASLMRLEKIIDRLRDPGFHLQHALENWNNFLILPLFAFFNTGILFAGASFGLIQPEALGTILGLVVGKPLGIVGFVFVAVTLGIATKAPEISWTALLGSGFLCGIGFTMSIFIASAAFETEQLQSVKLAILLASALAGMIGALILLMGKRSHRLH